jgi:hypothetical protein
VQQDLKDEEKKETEAATKREEERYQWKKALAITAGVTVGGIAIGASGGLLAPAVLGVSAAVGGVAGATAGGVTLGGATAYAKRKELRTVM